MTHHLIIIACGVIVGFSLALTGTGGSTLGIPLLLYVVGMQSIHLAIGTSAFAASMSAYANLVPHARAGHVRWRAAFVVTVGGVVGAIVGSEFGKAMNGQLLAILFAILIIIMALLMLRTGKTPNPAGTNGENHDLKVGSTGVGVGVVSGFFGVGGGFMLVPALMFATRMNIIDAIGTSLFGVGSFSLATGLNYARSGLVDWPVTGEFIIGGIAGGWIGALFAHRLSARQGALNILFSLVLIVIAIYMLIRTLHLFGL